MEIYFIRHGQSLNNAHWGVNGFQDVPDPELTEIGKEQAEQLANFLKKNQARDESQSWNSQNEFGFGLTHLYTSLMVRAVATAVPIAHHLRIPLLSFPEIHETGGIFSRLEGNEKTGLPGKTRSYFEANYPELGLPEWLDEQGWWNRPYEEKEARRQRAERVWAEVLERHGDRPGRPAHRLAIVSHGGFFNYLLTTALGVPLPQVDENRHQFWFLMNNCAISRFDWDSEQVLVCYLNRHEFLPNALIT
jgi:2,3-bisphosphoglycerate-dependent phosphoglycerate mutase